jgi:3-oxoacyl-[acyl-carrier-protein] synthase-3/clorobiocin biosynthesis protein CloN2
MYISGVGAYVPNTVDVGQAVAAGWYPPEDVELHQLSGAAVAGDAPAPELALRAARSAVARSGRAPAELDLLLYASTWHQGPEGWPPHAYVQRHLVGDRALATQLRQGCNGMFTALELAASYLRAAPGRAALLVAADNFGTPLADRWRMLPGAIAGDAGSALVLDTEPGFARLLSVCTVSVSQAEEMHRSAEPLFPPGITQGRILDFAAHNDTFRQRAMADHGDTGALATLQQRLAELIRRTTSEAGVKRADLTRVAFMNCGREVAEQLCESTSSCRCLAPRGSSAVRSGITVPATSHCSGRLVRLGSWAGRPPADAGLRARRGHLGRSRPDPRAPVWARPSVEEQR